MFGDWILCCRCVPTHCQLCTVTDWRFRFRDVEEGTNVLKPMPWTIPATSYLIPFEGHVASFQNAGYTSVPSPFFTRNHNFPKEVSWLSQFHRPKLVMVNTMSTHYQPHDFRKICPYLSCVFSNSICFPMKFQWFPPIHSPGQLQEMYEKSFPPCAHGVSQVVGLCRKNVEASPISNDFLRKVRKNWI